MRIPGSVLRFLGVGALVLSLSAVAVGIVAAQPGVGRRPDGPPPGTPGQPFGGGIAVFGELRDEFVSQLAANLGLPEDVVGAALRDTIESMRPLAEDRAREIRDGFRLSDGPRPEGDPGFDPRPQGRPGFGQQPSGPGRPQLQGTPNGPGPLLGQVAEILKMQPEALRAEIEQGKTLAMIAQDNGISPDALVDQLIQRMEQMRVQQMRDGIRRMLDARLPGVGDR